MLDSKIRELQNRFNIHRPSDWCAVDPHEIIAVDGVGPATLDYVRVLLANRNLTLKNDRTPEYWRQHLEQVKVSNRLGDRDREAVCPFTILIDSAETKPFTFMGLNADGVIEAAGGELVKQALIVPTKVRSLGRFPDSQGDYSIDGYAGRVGIERKSVVDLQGTLLGWYANDNDGEGATRRERFESELMNLNAMESSLIVVEGTRQECIATCRATRKRSAEENGKTVHRSIIAYRQDYRGVQWEFCDSRRLAEVIAFRWLWRFWEKRQQRTKQAERLLATL